MNLNVSQTFNEIADEIDAAVQSTQEGHTTPSELMVEMRSQAKTIRKLTKLLSSSPLPSEDAPTQTLRASHAEQTLTGTNRGEQRPKPKRMRITKMPVDQDPWPGPPVPDDEGEEDG